MKCLIPLYYWEIFLANYVIGLRQTLNDIQRGLCAFARDCDTLTQSVVTIPVFVYDCYSPIHRWRKFVVVEEMNCQVGKNIMYARNLPAIVTRQN